MPVRGRKVLSDIPRILPISAQQKPASFSEFAAVPVACVAGRRKRGKGSKRPLFARSFFSLSLPFDDCHAGYCSCEICSLGLPSKPFLAKADRRSFRDDGVVSVKRSESSTILSKSFEISFIIKIVVGLDQKSRQFRLGRLLQFLESTW